MRLMKPALDEASFLRGLVKEDEEIESLRLKSEKLLEALKFVETQTEQSESSVAVVIWERARQAIAEWEG